jgi:endonuclease/exonuclease/phosphatase family metal-dependent hydrolase
MAGNWSKTYNSSAAGQTVMQYPDAGAPKVSAALASPSSYFEMPFSANAGTAYRLWVRGKAESNSPYNDSVFVQFSGSVDAAGAAVYRIGTTGAATVNIEDDLGRGLSGWGWQDNGWGTGVMGPLVYFQASGTQTLRVQSREDGLSIDQIVLSAQSYLNSSPGALRNDTVILPSTIEATPPSNEPPQVSISATPTTGIFPLVVSFSSNASDLDGYIASYNWTFGDGQTSSLPFPMNTYQSAGTFTARLTVTDDSGATASASHTITVNAPQPPSGTQLKVLSWNLHFGRGTDSVYNLDRQATHIANINPDLAALCEISRYSGDDSVMILVNLLILRTGRTWYWHFVPKYSGCPEGNLILSKFPLVSTSFQFLSYQRSVAQIRVNVGGRSVNFFATHLDHTSSSIRYAQVGELTTWLSGFAEPRIIGGDFNAGPDTSEIARMTTYYHDTWMEGMNAGVAVAYPDNPVQVQTRTRRGRIDYLFYSRGATNLIVRASQVPDSRDLNNTNVVELLGTTDDRGVRPSDHNQVVTIFEVR